MGVVDVVVATDGGKVRGTSSAGTAAFLGIPYAAAPVGDRRFRPPVPVRWEGTRDAVQYGASAPQPARDFTIIPEPVIPGDDCLNLNVFTPDPGSARLPVLVWIHGGGFVAGSSASPWYRGESFAQHGIVTVSINYRLGAEGFLLLEDGTSNLGVLDWVAALRWVHANIAAFGGDPGNITVAGQSAGAAAASLLLTVPSSRQLFRRVIAMSGTPRFTLDSAAARGVAGALASSVGARPTPDALAAVPPARLLEAQDKVLESAQRAGVGAGALPFAPCTDGELIPEDPFAAISGGAGDHADLLVGATENEFNASAGRPGPVDLRRRLERLGFRADHLDAYRSAHPDADERELAAQAVTDAVFRVNAARLAEARAGASGATFAYEFRWRSPVPGVGAVHCLDVPFVFNVLNAPEVAVVGGGDPPQEVADEMHGAWCRFIAAGDPGWPRYERRRRTTMLFGTPSTIADDPLSVERQAWGV